MLPGKNGQNPANDFSERHGLRLVSGSDTGLVATAARSTYPSSSSARGMSMEAVSSAMRESQCARPIVRFKTVRPHAVSGPNLPVRSTWSVPRTGDPPVGPDLGIVPIMALPEGQDQRSIQIDGLRLLYESLKTLCGQNTLESRSQRRALVDPR